MEYQLTITFADLGRHTSSAPVMDASRLSEQIGEALRDARLQAPPTILAVRLEAVRKDAEALALAS